MKIISDLGLLPTNGKSNKKYRFAIYECPVCGNYFKTMCKSVNSGKTTKCRSCASSKYFAINVRILTAWHNINSRCNNKKHKSYSDYGERGIKNNFFNYKHFEEWAINNGYSDDLEIDRIDVNGNYEPSNCRWVTESVQSQNTRLIRSTNKSGYRGVNWSKSNKKWIARCHFNGKRVFLGSFECKEDAAIKYDNFVKSNGLKCPLNFKE